MFGVDFSQTWVQERIANLDSRVEELLEKLNNNTPEFFDLNSEEYENMKTIWHQHITEIAILCWSIFTRYIDFLALKYEQVYNMCGLHSTYVREDFPGLEYYGYMQEREKDISDILLIGASKIECAIRFQDLSEVIWQKYLYHVSSVIKSLAEETHRVVEYVKKSIWK
ncbi:hypothetical protein HanIR_Chr15g0781891 [Helianthus annuus]|nr:hypothetical protein HanIR_Chr15g0781891 [Helianthus annuus]